MARERRLSEVLKRGYSDKEVNLIFELGRFYIEGGNHKAAANIMQGLHAIVPDYLPALLALCCLEFHAQNYEVARSFAEQALKLQPESIESALFLVTCLMVAGDFNPAGSLLGEIGEHIATRDLENPDIERFYKTLLVRYEVRA